MGIFNFKSEKPKKSLNIQDLFKLDIHLIPNDSFYEQGEPIEVDGKIVRTFSKVFIEEKDYECGLFDVIDVKTFQGLINRNLILTNESMVVGECEMKNINRLTDRLHQVYGTDDDGNKRFTNNDIQNIYSGYWHRHWSKNKNPAMLNFDINHGLNLTIWITE